MNLGGFIYDLNQNTKKLVRRIEKYERKLIHIQSSLVFNEICINENILPNYTRIRPHDPAARSEQCTMEYRKQLVKRQIKAKKEESENVQQELNTLWSEFNSILEDGDRKKKHQDGPGKHQTTHRQSQAKRHHQKTR